LSSPSLKPIPSNFKQPKNPVSYIEIRVSSHATEDVEKVQTAVRNILPETVTEELTFTTTNLNGHHGNPITLLEVKLDNRKLLPSVIEQLGSKLSSLDKETLNEDFKIHIEKSSLFLRFDKQSAFLGAVKLGSNDPIRLKIHFKNLTPQEIEATCKKVGLLP